MLLVLMSPSVKHFANSGICYCPYGGTHPLFDCEFFSGFGYMPLTFEAWLSKPFLNGLVPAAPVFVTSNAPPSAYLQVLLGADYCSIGQRKDFLLSVLLKPLSPFHNTQSMEIR